MYYLLSLKSFLLLLKKFLLMFIFEREREREREREANRARAGEGQREKLGEIESQAGLAVLAKPDVGCHLTNGEIMT